MHSVLPLRLHRQNDTAVVERLLGYFVLRLLMTRAVTGDSAEIEVTGVQAGDSWAEIMVVNGLTDVELVNLDAMYFVSLHRHVRPPSRSSANPCHPVDPQTSCVAGDRRRSTPETRSELRCAASTGTVIFVICAHHGVRSDYGRIMQRGYVRLARIVDHPRIRE
jgi:hypothetical protein